MKYLFTLVYVCLTLLLLAPPSVAQVVCKTDIAPNGAHLGCSEQTKNRKCTKVKANDGTCIGTIECACVVPEKSKGGGVIALTVFIGLIVGWSALRALVLRPLKN